MPPVMITCVTPTAMMPITETCRMMIGQALLIEQEALADEDPAEHLEGQRDADQHEQDADFRRQLALRDCWAGCAPLGGFGPLLMSAFADRLLIVGALQCDASSMILTWSASARSRMPVTRPSCITMMRSLMPSTLRHLRGDHDHRDALAGELRDQPVDLGLGADVDAARRLVEDQDAAAWSAASGRSAPSAGCRRKGS